MRLHPIFTALLATLALFPPTVQSRSTKTVPATLNYCVGVPLQHTSATILRRKQRPTPKEISLSPPALNAPSSSITENPTRANNATSSTPHALPPLPPWFLTVEDVVTAIFRIIITALTLFNVNVTWRIRGECQRKVLDVAKTDMSNSQSGPSAP